MLNNVIDPVTGLPRKLGELYNDRNIRLVGEMRWDAATSKVDTKNLRIISTPNDGGSPAITVIPDGSYTLSAANTSIWIQLRRTSGTTTVALGTSLVADVTSQSKPRTDWIQLFVRTSTNDIVTLGNWVVLAAPQWTKAGVTRGTSIYDAIVGSASNPFATHTTIQGAIDDALDGDRILVLSGQYSLGGPGNSVVDPSSALSWSGKTLTLEGEGYSTVVQNTGSLSRAFSIVSTNASSNASFGNGSRVINMHLKNYPQTIRFDGGSGFGLRHCFADLYTTAVSSYVAPEKTGTGVFAANVVKEQATVGSTFTARQTVVGTDVVIDVQTESSAVLSSTGSRFISVQNALRIGDTNAPTQELDVVGDMRTTTGILHTAASSLNIVTDSGLAHNVKAKTLVLSDSLLDTASSQSLLVQGTANIATALQVGGLSNIASVARTSNIVTLTTASSHPYFPGQSVTVNALTNISVNGTYVVASVPSPTSFTYANIGSNITSVATSGTVRAEMEPFTTLDINGNVHTTTGILQTSASSVNVCDRTLASHHVKAKSIVLTDNLLDTVTSQKLFVQGSGNVSASLQIGGLSTIATVSRTGNVTTITTSNNHNYYNGLSVTVQSSSVSSVNGTFSILSVPTPTTFTYTQTGTNIVSTASSGQVRADLSPVQTVDVIGSMGASGSLFTKSIITVQSNYTVTDTDYLIIAGGTTSYIITLPTASASNRGRNLIFKSTNTTQFVRISAQTGQLVDGRSTSILLDKYETITLVSDGTTWMNVSAPLNEGRGAVPIGSVIAMGSLAAWSLPGASEIKDGYALCNGAAYPVGSNTALTGNRPNLSDSRFLQGSNGVGGTGGANSKTLAVAELPVHNHGMSHTHEFQHSHWLQHAHYMQHSHNMDHNHGRKRTDDSGNHSHSAAALGGDGGGGVGFRGYSGGDRGFTGQVSVGDAGTHSHEVDIGNYTANTGGSRDWTDNSPDWTGGVNTTTTGGSSISSTGNTGSGTSFDLRPQYFNVVYLIRVI